MSGKPERLEALTLKLSDVVNSLVAVYADQNLSVTETDREIGDILANNTDIEEVRDEVLSLNGIQKPPAGICPLKDLNDEIVEITQARGSASADGIKRYMDLFRSAAEISKGKSRYRSDRIVRTEDLKAAAVDLGMG